MIHLAYADFWDDYRALPPDIRASADKQFALFPESYHLLLHDHDKAEVLARIEAWLLAQLSR